MRSSEQQHSIPWSEIPYRSIEEVACSGAEVSITRRSGGVCGITDTRRVHSEPFADWVQARLAGSAASGDAVRLNRIDAQWHALISDNRVRRPGAHTEELLALYGILYDAEEIEKVIEAYLEDVIYCVAVATDRRVIVLRGYSKLLESPYESIGEVGYDAGLFGGRPGMTITGVFTTDSKTIFGYDSRDLRAFADCVHSHLVWTA